MGQRGTRSAAHVEGNVSVGAGILGIARNRQPGSQDPVQADVVYVAEVLCVGIVDPVDGQALPVQRQVLYPDPGTDGGAKRHHGAARKATLYQERGARREAAGSNVAAYADQVRARRQVPRLGNNDGPGGQEDG